MSATMISALKMIADRMALCGVEQLHNVERLELRIEGEEQRRDDGEILRHVVGDGERRQRAARHQQLLADLDDLDELGRIGVEIDHVAGFARGLGAGIHGDTDIGLSQSRRIVGAVAAHGDELALCLLVADQLQLLLWRCLREEIVDAGFRGDCRSGHRVVAGDHDGADAHAAELGEALADAALDDVLELDDAAVCNRARITRCIPCVELDTLIL